MKLSQQIQHYLSHPDESVNHAWVEATRQRYPFFTLPATMLLSRQRDIAPDAEAGLTRWLALNVADRGALMTQLRPEATGWADFYPPEPKAAQLTTDQTIDRFIDTYGSNDPAEEELLTKLIFNPTPDYAQILANEEEKSSPRPDDAPEGSQDALINSFILKSKQHQGHFPSASEQPDPTPAPQPDPTPVATPEENDPSMLTESLAKIYIRQRRYAKAYEIIEGLSLNYPEKSIYFADQLRFLQKLMINQRHIDKKQN